MLIKKLIIQKTHPYDEIIRDILFNLKGLNLIVDNTPNISQATGNSVGKSTVLRIIDLCLGGKSVSSIYKDGKDTKTSNDEIKSFLNKNKVIAKLIILDCDGKEYILQRDLFNNGKRYINNKIFTQDDYWFELKKILFKSVDEQPTFRQLISRFVRIEDEQLENIITYLGRYTDKKTYENIHLYFFDPNNSSYFSDNQSLQLKLNEANNDFEFFKNKNNIDSFETLNERKVIIEKELIKLNEDRSKINYIESFKEEFDKKTEISNILTKMNSDIEKLNFDITLNEKSINELNKDKSNIDIEKLKILYSESEKYIKLTKNFEELITFHNNMIDNRISFISKQLNKKKQTLNELIEKQSDLLKQKQTLSIDLIDDNLVNDLFTINEKIDILNIEKGKIIKLIEQYNGFKTTLDNAKNGFDKFIKNNSQLDIDDKIKKFSTFFQEYSKLLYAEPYFFTHNISWKEEGKNSQPFSIGNMKGNLGTGKKKALVVAFDLAYLKYISNFDLHIPQFIIHDKLENTHINQLKTIFEVCSEINGQYIVPILRERVSKVDQEIIENSKILELREDDKLFRI